MPLWGNNDNASGNGKPVFANTSNSFSNSFGSANPKANTSKYYGNVYGVSATEEAVWGAHNPDIAQHAGWVSQKIGTGPIQSISLVSGGSGINANGFLTITNNTAVAGASGGANANVAYFVSSNANSQLNVVTSIVINNGGDSFALPPTLTVPGNTTVQPTFTVVLGGRAGRRQYETLVATGTITNDDPRDNAFFPGT